MVRFIALFILMITSVLHSEAQLPMDQQRYLDSLNNVLKQATSDSVKARTNYFLVYYWLPRDAEKARQYLEEGRRLSKSYPYLIALSYAHEGYFYYTTDIVKSEAAYLKADTLLSKYTLKEAYLARTNIWTNYAALQQKKDDDKAHVAIILNKAIPLALKAEDSVVVGSLYVALGVAFMNMEQYGKAEEYLNNAIQVLKRTKGQTSRLIAAYNRAGENYMLLQRYDAAKLVLDTVKGMLSPYPSSELYAGYYLVEGMYYNHLKQYDRATASFDKGIAVANGPNKDYVIQELQFLKVKALIAGRKYDAARQVLLLLTADEQVMGIDNSRAEVYHSLAESYAGLGNMHMAYKWMKHYSELSDTLAHSELRNDVNALEVKFKNAEKQKEINSLKAKNEQAALEAKNNRLVSLLLGTASVCLLAVAVFSYLYYRSNRKLFVQKELSHQQHLKDLEQQQRLQFGQAVLLGEEQERRRLARDLHDGLGGMLAGVKINLSGQAADTASQNQKDELQKIIGQLDHSVTELRRIAHNMMPVNLLKFGLRTALKDICESLMTDSTSIDFQAYGIENDIPEQTQLNIYRIVQELLANAIRHANAAHIILQCSQNGNSFLITQEDNGKGFNPDMIEKGKGIGLENIKNRVGFLKGKMEIESVINEGTIINIELYV